MTKKYKITYQYVDWEEWHDSATEAIARAKTITGNGDGGVDVRELTFSDDDTEEPSEEIIYSSFEIDTDD